MSALQRVTLGRLVAYAATPESGVVDAFNTADWDAPTGVTLALVSGALRSSGVVATRYITNNKLASRADVYVQVVVGAGSGGGSGVAARVVAAASPNTAVGYQIPTGASTTATEQLLERVAGSVIQADATASLSRLPAFRLRLKVKGTTAAASIAGVTGPIARALTGLGLTGAGRIALYHSQSGAGVVLNDAVLAMTDSDIAVTGLPSGWQAQVLDAGDTVLGSATESGGTAVIDGDPFDFPAPRKIRLLNAVGGIMGTFAPTLPAGVWGGDVYENLLPPAPTGVVIDAPTTVSLRISWAAVTGATSYDVERSPNGSTGWTTVSSGAATSVTDSGLSDATAYYYRVRATTAAGTGDWSVAASGTTRELFLVVAGITVPVSPSGAAVLPPERLGGSARMFYGGLRSTVRVEKRGWRFRTPSRPVDEWAAFEAAVARGTFVSCRGEGLGATVTCEVTISDADLAPVPGGFRKAFTLTLREV